MALVPIWHGRIDEDGKLVLFDTERTPRRAYLRTLIGKTVEIIVRKERKQRTKKQNAFIHAVPIPILADFFGEDLEETKRLLMGECFGWKTNDRTGERVPVKPHTSDMSDEECSYFIDWVVPWAMTRWNVAIPLPGEAEAA